LAVNDIKCVTICVNIQHSTWTFSRSAAA